MILLRSGVWPNLRKIVNWVVHHPATGLGIEFPLVVLWIGWRRRRHLSPSLRWMMLYLAVTWFEDNFMIYWTPRNNLWMIHLYTPVEVFLLGSMFAHWQLRERWRGFMIAVVWIFVAWWVVMMLTVENFFAFPRFTKAVASLLVIMAASWTLVIRTRHTVAPLTRHPWFWVSVGTMLYFAYVLLLNPVAFLLIDSNPGLVRTMFNINGVLVMVMYLCWIRGLLLVPRSGPSEATS